MNGEESNVMKPIVWKSDKRWVGAEANNDDMLRFVDIISSGSNGLLEDWLRRCTNVNIKDSFGNAPLHWAATVGTLDAVRSILLKGGKVDIQNDVGATPLHCAAIGGNVAVIERLLRGGADPRAVNHYGQTMFDLLRSMKLDHISVLYEHLEKALQAPERGVMEPRRHFVFGKPLGCLSVSKLEDSRTGTHGTVTANNQSETTPSGKNDFIKNGVVMHDVDKLVRGLYATELQLLCTRESSGRDKLITDYFDGLVHVMRMVVKLHSSIFNRTLPDEMTTVLGERYTTQGEHLLPYSEEKNNNKKKRCGRAGCVAPFIDVAHFTTVNNYTNRSNQSFAPSTTSCQGETKCSNLSSINASVCISGGSTDFPMQSMKHQSCGAVRHPDNLQQYTPSPRRPGSPLPLILPTKLSNTYQFDYTPPLPNTSRLPHPTAIKMTNPLRSKKWVGGQKVRKRAA